MGILNHLHKIVLMGQEPYWPSLEVWVKVYSLGINPVSYFSKEHPTERRNCLMSVDLSTISGRGISVAGYHHETFDKDFS